MSLSKADLGLLLGTLGGLQTLGLARTTALLVVVAFLLGRLSR
jgi:hypothetical protein